MGIEIERKFLVVGTAWRQAVGVRFSQGYLNRDKERTVRVRLAGDGAFLTIKGRTEGASRAEFEYAIPVTDGEQLLKLCEWPVIEKIRRVIVHDGATWEVDEFLASGVEPLMSNVRSEEVTDPRHSKEKSMPLPSEPSLVKISAVVRNAASRHEVAVSTAGSDQSLTVPPKSDGAGSNVNGDEFLMLALATCYCNDLYREAARLGTSSGGLPSGPGSTERRAR